MLNFRSVASKMTQWWPFCWYARVACATRFACAKRYSVCHYFHLCSFFFFFFFFLSPDRTFLPTCSKMKKTKVVGISLSYRKELGKNIGVPPGTLYTPHLTLIWG